MHCCNHRMTLFVPFLYHCAPGPSLTRFPETGSLTDRPFPFCGKISTRFRRRRIHNSLPPIQTWKNTDFDPGKNFRYSTRSQSKWALYMRNILKSSTLSRYMPIQSPHGLKIYGRPGQRRHKFCYTDFIPKRILPGCCRDKNRSPCLYSDTESADCQG